MTDKFYLSQRWKSLRNRILARARYIDQLRIREGVSIEANTVHHIFPREGYPEYQWETWNLIAINDRTHKALHTITGELSKAGQRLLAETAQEQGIPISKMILVVGMPGSGKTTLAKSILAGGLAYDLDYISSALRLRSPHSERHEASRQMANKILKPFIATAKQYVGRVIVIRSAPDIEEVAEIDPDEIFICKGVSALRKNDSYIEQSERDLMKKRIEDIELWAKVNGIPITVNPPPVN